MSRYQRNSRENRLRKDMEDELFRNMYPRSLANQAGTEQIPEDLRRRFARGRHDISKPLTSEEAPDFINYYATDQDKAAGYVSNETIESGNYVAPVEGERDSSGELIYGPSSFGKDNDTEVPTSTTNPDRPRTLAASYNEDKQTLTVMFRDGTVYNYYSVSRNEWQQFHSEQSKGLAIVALLDDKPRGPADTTDFPEEVRQSLYMLAAAKQNTGYKPLSTGFSRQQTKRMKNAIQKHPRGWLTESWDVSDND